MSAITEKQILEWKEELKTRKERKEQAQAVVEQESKFISMIEGGIQFGEMLLKKNESSDQPTNTEASSREQGQIESKSKA